jgi:hypothetical protein
MLLSVLYKELYVYLTSFKENETVKEVEAREWRAV